MPSGNPASRTIVVTGGGSGIGRAVALLCAKRGDNIAVPDINSEQATITAEQAASKGANSVLGVECDVADENQVAEAFARISERLGPPYGLFANAGIDIGGLIHEL